MKHTGKKLTGKGILDLLDRDKTGKVIEIETSRIFASRYQPRLTFDEASLEELTSSIRSSGLIQPITVRETEKGYEIIAGERRYRACVNAGFTKIPCYILSPSESQAAEMALIENIQREDLTAVEEAKSYVQLMNQTGMTQEQLAARIGKSQSSVANKIRLLNLPEEVQEAVAEKKISERHARALLKLPEEKQVSAYRHIVEKELNVRQTDEYVEKSISNTHRRRKTKGFARNVRIALNSVDQCVRMIRKMGINAGMDINDSEEETTVVIRIPKK